MTTKPEATPDPRAEYISGLRALADLLEQHPELKTPHYGIDVIPHGPEQSREQLAVWARALPGKKDKQISEKLASLVGYLRGVKVTVIAYRDEVCERVTTGVETVTKKVKDPEALAAVPEVEVTEEVETYEWICRPMLADEQVGASA
jgi:hypothetical protein